MTPDHSIDEAFVLLREDIIACCDVSGQTCDPAAGIYMSIEEFRIETPIELDLVVQEDGRVRIGCVPPLYHVDTTIQPVFHQLRLRAVACDPSGADRLGSAPC